MANCELCGNKPARFDTEIEGTRMNVCEDCARFGKVKGSSNVKIIIEDRKRPEIKELTYIFLPDFGNTVKQARERLGLKQDEMAKKLNERESLLHQIESGHFTPNIDLARKLERMFHIKIFEEVKDGDMNPSDNKTAKSSGEATLGDFIKKR